MLAAAQDRNRLFRVHGARGGEHNGVDVRRAEDGLELRFGTGNPESPGKGGNRVRLGPDDGMQRHVGGSHRGDV